MTPLRERRNLPLLLLEVRESMLSHFRHIFNHFGLTDQQWRVIRVLGEHGEIEQCQVAEACLLLAPSLAGVLTRMEDAGLVRRRRHETDLRRVLVSLTDKGQDIIDRAVPLIMEQYAVLEETLGREMIDDFYRMVDAYLEKVSRTPVRPVSLPPLTPAPSSATVGRKEKRTKTG